MPVRSKPAAHDQMLGQLLTDAIRLLRRDFHQRARGLNLTPALSRLLLYVHRDPGTTQVALATRLEVTPVTLSRMLDRLVKFKYVRRVADPADRRIFRVCIDTDGEPLVGRMIALSTQTTAKAVAGMSKAEQATLERLLAALCSNLARSGK